MPLLPEARKETMRGHCLQLEKKGEDTRARSVLLRCTRVLTSIRLSGLTPTPTPRA